MEKYEIVLIYDNILKREIENVVDNRTTDTMVEIAFKMIDTITKNCKDENIPIHKTLKCIENNLRRCDLIHGSMKPEDFIKSELDKLVLSNNKIRTRLEILNFDTYIIEILPRYIYENDESYIEFEDKLRESFEELYYDVSMHFISENALLDMTEPIYVATGSEYNDKNKEELFEKLAIEKFKSSKPSLENFNNITEINVIDAYILYRLVTNACSQGSKWMFEYFENEFETISISKLVKENNLYYVYRYNEFKEYLTK